MNAAIEHDAREFGLHVKQGGWRLGLLVARNVERGAGGPRTGSSDPVAKVTIREFAEQAETSHARIGRYLLAWEAAAEEGLVPLADDLSPGDEIDLDVDALPAWDSFYDASRAGGYNGGAERTPTYENVKKAADKLPPAERVKLAAEIEEDVIEGGNREHRAETTRRLKKQPVQAYQRLGTYIAGVTVAVRK